MPIKKKLHLLALSTLLIFPANLSASECGLSCCIAGAAEGIGAGGSGLYLNVQYEYMKMGTILEGTSERSVNDALKRYKIVPTEMVMQKLTTNIAYGINSKVSLLASIPYVRNDMDMMMNMMVPPMVMAMPMSMDKTDGIGDITLMGFYKLYTDRNVAPTARVTAGLGIKTPTGKDDERKSNGELVHVMMQPGSGSWDPIVLINGMKAFGKTYLLGTVTYQITTENDLGYEIGDKLNIDVTVKQRLSDLFNATLALNYVNAKQDKTDGSGNYQNAMSMIDNVQNTGLTSYFITPGIEFKPSAGSAWSLNAKARFPVEQDVKGIQQVTDDWYIINAAYRF